MDLNPNCLEGAGNRIARYCPEIYRANVLDPMGREIPRFDSISMTYLLHCFPGTIKTKSAVFQYLKPLLNTGGVVFGATLLSHGVKSNWAAKRLMAFYNSKGIFTNDQDDLQGLRAVLSEHLTGVSVEVAGCAALFSGRV